MNVSPDLIEATVRCRRDLHRYPELSWTEFRTTAKVAAVLDGLGYQLHFGEDYLDLPSVMGRTIDVAAEKQRAAGQGADPAWLARMGDYSGLAATMSMARPGPVIALRFDIDALPVTESQSSAHAPCCGGFASDIDGKMHACGHDGHTAIGVSVARWVVENRERLAGEIRLIFQPGEEGCCGGKAVAKGPMMTGVDYFLAMHLGINVPSGAVVVNPTGFLATTKFDMTFTGRPAHAGIEPNAGANALACACTAINQMLAIPSHRDGMTRINIGSLVSDGGRNVIPASARLCGETRGETQALDAYMMDAVQRICQAAGAMHGVDVELTIEGEAPDCDNSPELVARLRQQAEQLPGINDVVEQRPFGASEDATWMVRAVQAQGGQGVYFIMGSDLPEGHHKSGFDIDEAVLGSAVALMASMVESLTTDPSDN